jgi:hypothetical protein
MNIAAPNEHVLSSAKIVFELVIRVILLLPTIVIQFIFLDDDLLISVA